MSKKKETHEEKKYYTLTPVPWDSYEGKSLRNKSVFEIGFIGEKNKKPETSMVYPVERKKENKKERTYYLGEHTLKNTESVQGYTKYLMECTPLYQVELVRKDKKDLYGSYRQKQTTRKTTSRQIKQNNPPTTKFTL